MKNTINAFNDWQRKDIERLKRINNSKFTLIIQHIVILGFIILCTYFLMSCKTTNYVILSYDRTETSVGYVYLLQRTTFPKFYKDLYTRNTCKCMMPGDTIYFTRDNDSLVPNKVRYRK